MARATEGNAYRSQVNVLRITSALLVVAAIAHTATAVPKKAAVRRWKPVATMRQASAPVQTAYRRSPYVGAISADAETGRILFADNADAKAYPASVTKLMTLLIVLEDIAAGKYSLDDSIRATPDVNRCEASWVGIKTGESMTVRDLCLALMVESANDAAIVLAVNSAGSFDGFVERMNSRAKELGMENTTYYNPNGLPPNAAKRYPWKSFNVSTASDLLKLARRLLKIPETLAFTSVKTCDLIKTGDGYRISVTRRVNEPFAASDLQPDEKLVKQLRNHNNVMVKDKLKVMNPDGREAIDGLKTGYIDAGGSSVVMTGSRNGKRAIAIILGSASSQDRDANAARLMSDALGALAW